MRVEDIPPEEGIEEYFQRFNAEDVKELSTEIDKLLSLKLPGGEEELEIYLLCGNKFSIFVDVVLRFNI
ncbi:MAG: hypothetical protein U0Y96_09925 [Candidatus Kapaibacterium sp.]